MEERQLLRPVWAEVRLSAFRANVETVSKLIPPRTPIMPVIKADAYGIGATMAARAVADLTSVIGFAVAIPEEAIRLREDGVKGCILVLGPSTLQSMIALGRNGVSVAVASVRGVEDAITAANQVSTPLKVHLKIETGMGRVGIAPGEDLEIAISKLRDAANVEIEGVFTHFSAADVDREYTLRQFATFEQALDQLARARIRPKYRHASNSAAILDFPKAHLDLVRPGIMIYGAFPDKSLEGKAHLLPVLTLYARVTHVKIVPAGATIGYGRTYTATKDTTIATIPIGYADGYPRLLSGRGSVLLRGNRYRIAGRVCMDQTMIEIDGPSNVQPGDLVTLIGTDGEETITVDDVADLAGTISHEILTGLTARVPRVYTQ